MTPFERFFAGDYQRLVETCRIPAEAWSTPPATNEPEDMSWDRRAAWLLFFLSTPADRASQLVPEPAPDEPDPYDGY